MNICAEHQAAASKHVRGERTCVCRFSWGFQRVNTKQPQSATTALPGWCVSEFRPHVRTCFGLTGALFAVTLCLSAGDKLQRREELAEDHSWRPGGCISSAEKQSPPSSGLQDASSGLALTFLKSTFFLKGSFMDSSLQVLFLKLK